MPYSYDWSLKTVILFTERHARATEFFAKMTGKSRDHVIKIGVACLMGGCSANWEAFKRVIKAASHEKYADYASVPRGDREKYLNICLGNARAEFQLSEKSHALPIDSRDLGF